MRIISSSYKMILDFALPPRCPICGITVQEDHRFCLSCWQDLKFLNQPWCSLCGAPFAFDRGENECCAHCLVDPPDHDGVRAAVVYDDMSALVAMRLKYGNRLGLAELIAKQLARFDNEIAPDALIIPVPLHRSRLWRRGFNQSVLIADGILRRTQAEQANRILVRTTATPPLRSASARQRQKLVRGAFGIAKGCSGRIEGREIILVDDIYTSGATANACAKTLKAAGAARVLVFCWARVLRDGLEN